MATIQRVGDKNVAGGAILQGDNTVFVDGKAIAVENMPVSAHNNFKGPHVNARTTAKTSGLFVNGKRVVTSDDVDTCGHKRGPGSQTVGG